MAADRRVCSYSAGTVSLFAMIVFVCLEAMHVTYMMF